MSFGKKTIKDVNFKNKRVLVRADFNVPLIEGAISDDFRIRQALPTIEYLVKQKCRVAIISHLGRPKGRRDRDFSLRQVAKRLSDLLDQPVGFVYDCIGPEVESAMKALQPGQVTLLENLRFHKEEEANDEKFAKALAAPFQFFVQDGFGVVHRAHASTDGVTKHLPSVAGLLLEKECEAIENITTNPRRPLVAIVGGAKISDKISVLKSFINMVDVLVVGGAMANTFLLAEGVEVGKSVVDKDEISLAKDIMALANSQAKKRHFVFYLPQDGVVASKIDKRAKTRIVDWSAHIIADIENYPKRPPLRDSQVKKDEYILDIGPFSGAFIAGTMQLANSAIWSGSMGVTETPALEGPVGPFAHGTELLIEALLGQFGHRPYSLVGGGDTVAYVEQRGLTSALNHVSTGGSSFLELISGKQLPGVSVLEDR